MLSLDKRCFHGRRGLNPGQRLKWLICGQLRGEPQITEYRRVIGNKNKKGEAQGGREKWDRKKMPTPHQNFPILWSVRHGRAAIYPIHSSLGGHFSVPLFRGWSRVIPAWGHPLHKLLF